MPGLSPFNDPMTGPQINARINVTGLTLADDKFTVTGSADATKTFKFELDGMATGVNITWTGGAQTADRSISLPVLTANDTLSVLGLAQTYSALKTFSAGLTASSITNSSLTSGRIPFASTAGLMTDSAQFTFDQSGAIYSRVISLSGVGSCGWQTADGTRTWLFGSNSGTFQVYDATAAASRVQVNASGQLRVMVATGTSLLVSSTDAVAISCAGGGSFANGLTVSSGTTAVQALTATSATISGLTTGRVAITTTGGLLATDAGLTYTAGTLQLGDGTTNAVLNFVGTAGGNKDFYFCTGTSAVAGQRWTIRSNNTAESGSDAGSNWQLIARTDAGAAIDSPIFITRAAGGAVIFARPVTLSTASTGLTIAATSGQTLKVDSTTTSTSVTTGCSVFGGGVGVGGTLYTGGRIFSANGLQLDRASTSAFAEQRFATAATTNWTFGLRSGDSDFHVTDTAIAADAITVAQGAAGTITTPRPISQTGATTFGTGTGAVSLNGDVTIASGKILRLGNTYVAGAPGAATGTITIRDAAGTTYRIPVLV